MKLWFLKNYAVIKSENVRKQNLVLEKRQFFTWRLLKGWIGLHDYKCQKAISFGWICILVRYI